jgi:CubicO group peptidase (beta-lactamase class C family)
VPADSAAPALAPDAVRSAVAYLDEWLAFRRRYQRVPGVQAAVWHDGGLVLSTAHGVTDVATGQPLTTSHLFRVASHSKTFTATAVLQLHERGRLRLDDRLDAWLPWVGEAPLADRTLRELLAHGAGVVRDGQDGDFWQLFHPFPDAAGLRETVLSGADVLPANDTFKYSNIGYGLLGLVVEAAAGEPWADYVRREVVDRLGLERTGPELDPARADEYVTGHTALAYAEHRVPVEHVDTGALAAATGFYSTAEDLCRWAAAHFLGDDRLLTDASKRLAQRSEWQVAGTETHYGLGFGVSEIGDRRVVGHGGGYPGQITRTLFDPVAGLAVSVLTNAIDGPALEMATAAVRLLDLAAAHPDPADGHDLAALDGFTGRFATLWGVMDVVRLGGRLYGIDPTGADPAADPAELEVVDATTLRFAKVSGYGSFAELLHVTRDDDGAVVGLRGGSGSSWFPLERFATALAATGRVRPGSPVRPA